jgi:hypothetical protein
MTVVLTRALEVLREFVRDIQDVYPGEEALGLIDEWPDLHVTYEHARRVLAMSGTVMDPRQKVVEFPLPMLTESDLGAEPPLDPPEPWNEWIAKVGVLRFRTPKDTIEIMALGGMTNALLVALGRERASDWLRRALSPELRLKVLEGWKSEAAWLSSALSQETSDDA